MPVFVSCLDFVDVVLFFVSYVYFLPLLFGNFASNSQRSVVQFCAL